jgi:signal peptidase I
VSFIKRIVAGRGDRRAICEGRVILCGKRQPDPIVTPRSRGRQCEFRKPIRIPPDHWFMMGADRGASDDSRYWPAGRAGAL